MANPADFFPPYGSRLLMQKKPTTSESPPCSQGADALNAQASELGEATRSVGTAVNEFKVGRLGAL